MVPPDLRAFAIGGMAHPLDGSRASASWKPSYSLTHSLIHSTRAIIHPATNLGAGYAQALQRSGVSRGNGGGGPRPISPRRRHARRRAPALPCAWPYFCQIECGLPITVAGVHIASAGNTPQAVQRTHRHHLEERRRVNKTASLHMRLRLPLLQQHLLRVLLPPLPQRRPRAGSSWPTPSRAPRAARVRDQVHWRPAARMRRVGVAKASGQYANPPTHSFTHSFNHPPTDSLTHSPTQMVTR